MICFKMHWRKKIDERYAFLYTNGILTKTVFRKLFVLFSTHYTYFGGTRNLHFLQFQKLLLKTKYFIRKLS